MKPNFFIVGAPKCGTTSLARYLSQHENVFFSTPKEPAYFARHLWLDRARAQLPSFRTDLPAYEALFADADPARHMAVGEGSTLYLCTRQSLAEIRDFAPEAKIIVMLRNPVDLAYSMHSEVLLHLREDEPDFETAWRLQPARARGERIPKAALRAKTLQYGEMAQLGAQMQTLLDVFARDQVKWIFFDDFKADTAGQYRGVLDFLGLPDDGRTEFPAINTNEAIVPSGSLRFLKQAHGLRRLSGRLKRAFGVRSWGIVEKLKKRDSVKVARAPLSAEFRAELIAHFREDVQLLETLTDRDLSAWRTPVPDAVSQKP